MKKKISPIKIIFILLAVATVTAVAVLVGAKLGEKNPVGTTDAGLVTQDGTHETTKYTKPETSEDTTEAVTGESEKSTEKKIEQDTSDKTTAREKTTEKKVTTEKPTAEKNTSEKTTTKNPAASTSAVTDASTTRTKREYIGASAALDAALKHAGMDIAGVNIREAKLDSDDGIAHYDIEFTAGNREYEYEINALSGEVTDYDVDFED